jgi:hypothetical protein
MTGNFGFVKKATAKTSFGMASERVKGSEGRRMEGNGLWQLFYAERHGEYYIILTDYHVIWTLTEHHRDLKE